MDTEQAGKGHNLRRKKCTKRRGLRRGSFFGRKRDRCELCGRDRKGVDRRWV